jgi:hypothetical protein
MMLVLVEHMVYVLVSIIRWRPLLCGGQFQQTSQACGRKELILERDCSQEGY